MWSGSLGWLWLATVIVAEKQDVLTSNVNEIPLLGFGTWNVQRSNASAVVKQALKTGYRHLDCAAIYGNEKEVGNGIAGGLDAAEVLRSDVWVTSKLWNDHHAPEDVPKALDQTLTDLDLEYLDLYLMHWPVSQTNGKNKIDFIETWKAMTELPSSRVRHVGVSNFSPSQLESLLSATPNHKPYAHQMEMHPYLPQNDFLKWHEEHNIHVTAYSPFGNTNPTYGSSRKEHAASALPPLLESPLIKDIASKADCTAAQVALAWGMQRGTSVIPKSSHQERIEENFEATRCKLSSDDVNKLETALPIKRFNNPSKGWGVPLYDGLEDATVARQAQPGARYSGLFEEAKRALDAWANKVWYIFAGWESDL